MNHERAPAPAERVRGRSADPSQDSRVLVHRVDFRFLRSPPSELCRRVDVADEGSRAVGLRRLGAARYRARVHRCRRPCRRRAGGSVRAQAAADDLRGLSLDQSALLLFVDQLGSVVGYVGFGYASDFFGRRPSFTAFSIVKAVGLIMVTLGWGLTSGYSPTLFAFMFLVGVGEGNWGCIGPLLNEVFPTPVRAAALGIIYNVSRGVQFLAPVAITFVAARSSFGAGIALAAPFALLAGASVWALPETKGVKLTPVAVRSAESLALHR
ncbi:MAG: hypothetical protein DMG02_06985 [Acidobacteria bacterium]|nr:MAG: hypothetical protein DMG02_06985 [Acidobacteriota bacterium]